MSDAAAAAAYNGYALGGTAADMNLGDLDLQQVQHNRPQLQRIVTDDLPVTPVKAYLDNNHQPSPTSITSEAATVIRWETPPPLLRTPPPKVESPPAPPYTPTQNDFTTHTPRQIEFTKPEPKIISISANEVAYLSRAPAVVRFNEDQIRNDIAEASKRDRMDLSALESSPPTPHTDDTPYIRFAIDQLTRDQEILASQRPSTSASMESYPVERIIPDLGLGYLANNRHTREELALARKHRSSPDHGRLFRYNATRPLSLPSSPSPLPQKYNLPSSSEVFQPIAVPQQSARYPDLTFTPTILRPFSMMILSFLCLLMIVTIMFCAIYSARHEGLVEWAGGIYGGRYFLFQFLPQIFAALIFIYVQCVMAAVTRIIPYTMMAMNDARSRTNALFVGIYPRSLIFPRWEGPVIVNVAMTLFWLTTFTIPLQSCLFSVIPEADGWRWTAVIGIAWTLISIYFLILAGIAMISLFFFGRTTGLKWDPRSLADLIALLPRSNCLRDYPGTEILETKHQIRQTLKMRSDRLGYWTTGQRHNQEPFYCLGEEGATTRRYTLEGGKIQEKATAIIEDTSDRRKLSLLNDRSIRFRYISWQLRDTYVIFWAITAFVLLITLIIISFLPSTAIRKGFPPLVSAAPNAQGYSPANLLYSIVPCILGMLLYLCFQPLEMALRKLQPWAELGPEGATARQSLLLDYTANLPIACTINAFSARHYRIAFTSLLSTLFILIPILAGGLFFPLTTPAGDIRMIPNLPSFYIILVLLILYFIGLLILLPDRTRFHLPHGVDCLAEIFSFVHNSCILDDAAFSAVVSKPDLTRRLTARSARDNREVRYTFGVFRGRNEHSSLGIEKLGRRGEEVLVWGV